MMKWWTIGLLSSFILSNNVYPDDIVAVFVPKVIVQGAAHSTMLLSIEVKGGYHIQAHELDNEFIIPTTLEIIGNNDFILQKPIFPPSKKFKLAGTDTYLDVYDGRFEVRIFFTTTEQIQKKIHHLKGKLSYQACDSLRCFSPKTVEFLIEVEVR
jgi:hypothetical protein